MNKLSSSTMQWIRSLDDIDITWQWNLITWLIFPLITWQWDLITWLIFPPIILHFYTIFHSHFLYQLHNDSNNSNTEYNIITLRQLCCHFKYTSFCFCFVFLGQNTTSQFLYPNNILDIPTCDPFCPFSPVK